LRQAGIWIAATIAAQIAVHALDVADWLGWLPLIGLLVGVTVVPEMRWRRWRWDVRSDAIEIRHGTFTIRHTVVPMVRVQHVDTTSTLVEQWFELATVEIHTAAGSHEIPLLTGHDAEEVRGRIAALAASE
jgi:membrane protein YdbS with pleckstrin-like domain